MQPQGNIVQDFPIWVYIAINSRSIRLEHTTQFFKSEQSPETMALILVGPKRDLKVPLIVSYMGEFPAEQKRWMNR